VEQPPVSGTFNPRYLILTVVYAPPGTGGPGGTRSSVQYASSSTTGSAFSVDSSFKAEVDFSASASFLGLLETGISGGYSSASSDGRSIEVRKANTETITVQGGAADGINHDADLIYLWLNPRVAVVARDNNAQWAVGVNGPAMRVQYVYVGWLKNPATMPVGTRNELAAANITPDDYAQILSQDPFANGSTTIDPSRYRQTNMIYPYQPPFEQGAPSPSWQTQVRNTTISTTTSTTTSSYYVGYSISSGPFADWFGAKMKTSGKFTWTNTSKWSTSNDSTQSATLTITSPSFGYTGPTAIAVYWDTIYGSFMFAPAPLPTPSARGKMLDTAGKPVPHKEVNLVVGRKVWRTFTNMKGEYVFYGTPKGVGFLDLAGKRQRVLLKAGINFGDLKLTP